MKRFNGVRCFRSVGFCWVGFLKIDPGISAISLKSLLSRPSGTNVESWSKLGACYFNFSLLYEVEEFGLVPFFVQHMIKWEAGLFEPYLYLSQVLERPLCEQVKSAEELYLFLLFLDMNVFHDVLVGLPGQSHEVGG